MKAARAFGVQPHQSLDALEISLILATTPSQWILSALKNWLIEDRELKRLEVDVASFHHAPAQRPPLMGDHCPATIAMTYNC